ncbi:YbaB/EbfC family nucleoid-associated protein [Maribacter algarum]|uniref:Nucleoid-associated protein FEE95_11000 n=1 Tax=Maribacter algarum (ex Zhang et al. 2020) TaxID=2578118 RepID=A0A5S3PQN1_9FLAO|nr:YbaB/EbfC family nucleoid-associated protein [Maribacter algarum]TMM57012.1 YbaB/EbfC family nucleoid-associated protein [Maribacter algarum]
MFGDMMGMMGKLKETQQKVEATKKRLNTVSLEETSPEGLVKVVITANRAVKEIQIDEILLNDKEQLEDYLILTINKAIEKATQVNETELSAVAKEGMPNIPGMDNLFK